MQLSARYATFCRQKPLDTQDPSSYTFAVKKHGLINQFNQSNSTKYDVLKRINRAIDYIRDHYCEDLDLETLAKIACFSKYHFHRIFRNHTGETVNEFIRHIRMEKAMRILGLDRSKSITEIALDCGFSSSQNFAKAFKSYFGVSPSRIREEYNWNKITNIGEYIESLSQKEFLPRTAYFRKNGDTWTRKVLEQRESIQAKVIDMPSFHVAYIRIMGYDSHAGDQAFATLFQWASARGFIDENTMLIGVGWNDTLVTPIEKCIFDACITVPFHVRSEEPVHIQNLPGGKCAVHHCTKETHDIPEAWTRFIIEWVLPSGYRPDDQRPGFEIYYNDYKKHPLQHLILDLCLPIKPS